MCVCVTKVDSWTFSLTRVCVCFGLFRAPCFGLHSLAGLRIHTYRPEGKERIGRVLCMGAVSLFPCVC